MASGDSEAFAPSQTTAFFDARQSSTLSDGDVR